MASEAPLASHRDLIHSALRGVLEKCKPIPGSSRSSELNERTKEILEKYETNLEVFEVFSIAVTTFLQQEIKQTCDKLQATKTKRTKLWSLFHHLRNDRKGVLISKWSELLVALKIEVFDPICM